MEGGENLTPSQIVKEGPKSKSEMVDFREKQTDASRLAEYVTGLRPDDPRMSDRLTEDKKIIRTRYELPSEGVKFYRPSEYESKEKGEKVEPVWDNLEYFLKNVDGFNDKEIKDYKKESLGFVGDSVK